MRTIRARDTHYNERCDVLSVWFADEPGGFSHEDELDGGVFLSYDGDDPAYMEVWGFGERYGGLPFEYETNGLRLEVE